MTIDEIAREAAAFDGAEIDKMSGDEIKTAWARDKDAIWPTVAELAEFKRVSSAERRLPPKEAAE